MAAQSFGCVKPEPGALNVLLRLPRSRIAFPQCWSLRLNCWEKVNKKSPWFKNFLKLWHTPAALEDFGFFGIKIRALSLWKVGFRRL